MFAFSNLVRNEEYCSFFVSARSLVVRFSRNMIGWQQLGPFSVSKPAAIYILYVAGSASGSQTTEVVWVLSQLFRQNNDDTVCCNNSCDSNGYMKADKFSLPTHPIQIQKNNRK